MKCRIKAPRTSLIPKGASKRFNATTPKGREAVESCSVETFKKNSRRVSMRETLSVLGQMGRFHGWRIPRACEIPTRAEQFLNGERPCKPQALLLLRFFLPLVRTPPRLPTLSVCGGLCIKPSWKAEAQGKPLYRRGSRRTQTSHLTGAFHGIARAWMGKKYRDTGVMAQR